MRASLKTFAFALLAGCLTPACFQWEMGHVVAQTTSAVGTTGMQLDSPRRTAEQWLERARGFMQSGELRMAEYSIESAEKYAAQMPATETLTYTPAQARADLAKLTSQSQPAASEAMVIGDTAAPASVSHLLEARRSLVVGDVQRAKALVQEAIASKANFQGHFDSPERVQQMIDRQNGLAQLAAQGDAAKFNHDASVFLLEQADELMKYSDWATAESVILQAKEFPARFEAHQPNPGQMMAKLQAARGSDAASGQYLATAAAEAVRLTSQAQLAMDQNNWQLAQSLVAQAKALNVPDTQFGKDDVRPWELELKINEAMQQRGTVQLTVGDDAAMAKDVVQASYDSSKDRTYNELVNNESPDDSASQRAMEMYRSGMDAMTAGDRMGAKKYFEMAYAYRDNLDATTQQSLQDNLSQLSGTQDAATPSEDEAALFRKLQSDVFRERATAERMLNEKDARGALRHLTELQEQISQSALSADAKRPLLVIVDRDLEEMSQYIQDNIAEIEREETNKLRAESVENRRMQNADVEVKVQQLIEQFEKLCEEQRYPEAEVVARQAVALAPEMKEVEFLEWKAKFLRRQAEIDSTNDAKETGVANVLNSVDKAGTPFDKLIEFDADNWQTLSQIRTEALKQREGRSPAEEKIWNALQTQQFQGAFNAEPLTQVVDRLAQLSGVNMIFDRSAVDSASNVQELAITKSFLSPISVESALKLVIADAGLVFVVEDEVVKITSRDYQRKNIRQETYYVGDLVVPVQNNSAPMMMNFMNPFGNNPMGGIQATNGQPTSGIPLTMNQAAPSAQLSPLALAQQLPNSPLAGMPLLNYQDDSPLSGQPVYTQMAPQTLGGITAADFAELIQLIQNVIEPTSWEEEGPSIRPYANTLSLIVTNTQDVHDQIQDLLEKLRELNDVQIVVEVRFITLQDNFFERIGVDFDFDIEDHANVQAVGGQIPDQIPNNAVIGLRPSTTGAPLPTADLDVGFNQNSFASAIPQFGGFDASTAANFGFAILSDIEVFFLIQASKGDQRTNVMQAPTVTLINGQTATVFDGSFRPFVTSLIPIVGDFAAAQQPVISWMPEGSSLTVRGTASNDRRFITMSLVPFFSQISRVDTFTFESTRVTDQFGTGTGGEAQGGGGGGGGNDEDESTDTIIEGTTVQLPTLVTTTVATTVNVPDGGTVMIGGIKRLSEGRNERGVPFLSNIPYINRLFKNVGIGRETSSLMMMVTPRIIIQQEEEAVQVGQFGN